MDQPADPRGAVARMREQTEAADFVRRLFEATPRTWVTTALVVLNLGVLAVMVASGVSPMDPDGEDLVRFGADFGPLTASGQWWRLLSSTFVHIGLLHVGLNMWALWQSGRLAERFFGHGAYLFLYLASGIGASVTSLLWRPTGLSAGASGSIFGVFGGLLAVFLLHRKAIPPVLFRDLSKSTITVVAYNVLYGMSVSGIDNAAHLGGLASGFVLGLCLQRPLPSPAVEGARRSDPAEDSPRRFFRTLPVLALVVAGALVAKRRVDASPEVRSTHHFDLALEAFEAKDLERAKKEVETSLGLRPDDPRTLSLSGDVRWARGDRDGAATDYLNAARINPTYPYPRTKLAWLRQTGGDLEAAISYFTDVIRLDGSDADAHAGRGWVRLQSAKPAEALVDLDRALELDPRSELARWTRPFALYDLQRWPEALLGLRDGSADDSLPHLYVWAIRARTGESQAAAEELKSRFADAPEGDSRARIAAFLSGAIAQPDLLAQAEEDSQSRPDGQAIELCEAWYFVGLKNLLDGSREHALRAFRKCLETEAIETPACASAAAEIAVLER